MNRVEGLCESVTFQLEKVTQCKGRKNFYDEGEKRTFENVSQVSKDELLKMSP
jgi:hypothetical protein